MNEKFMNEIKNNIKKIKILIFLLLLFPIVIAIPFVIDTYNSSESNKNNITTVITLEDVKVAYTPDESEIYFIDRTDRKIKFVLDSNVSTAVFALMASDLSEQYKSIMENKK